jgi:hypothetical protein
MQYEVNDAVLSKHTGPASSAAAGCGRHGAGHCLGDAAAVAFVSRALCSVSGDDSQGGSLPDAGLARRGTGRGDPGECHPT